MEFKDLLELAQWGDASSQEEIFNLYLPLLYKYSMINGVFSEDLYQEQSLTLLHCMEKFKI